MCGGRGGGGDFLWPLPPFLLDYLIKLLFFDTFVFETAKLYFCHNCTLKKNHTEGGVCAGVGGRHFL